MSNVTTLPFVDIRASSTLRVGENTMIVSWTSDCVAYSLCNVNVCISAGVQCHSAGMIYECRPKYPLTGFCTPVFSSRSVVRYF